MGIQGRPSTDKAAQKRRPSSGSEEELSKSEREASTSKRRNVLQFWKRLRGSSKEVQAVVPEQGYSESSADSEAEGTSSPQAAGRPDDLATAAAEEMAAARIQRAWRMHVLFTAVEGWRVGGVTVERLRGLGFEAATELMQRPAVVRGSARLLETLLAQVARDSLADEAGQPREKDMAACAAPGRTFVAAHLFAAHPELLATSNTAHDAMIEAAATTTTQAYEQFSSRFLESSHSGSALDYGAPTPAAGGYCCWSARLQSFVSSFHAFAVALDSWKRADSRKLLAAMERHYLELDRLWQSVQRRTLGRGDEGWRLSIHEQRAALVNRVRTLGGPHAVDQLVRRQRSLRLTYADVQPSRTPSLPPPQQAQAQPFRAEEGEGGRDPAAEAVVGDASSSALGAVVAKAVSDPSAAHVDRILGNFDLTASAALEDASLAHELVLDPELRLEPLGQTAHAGSVQHTVARAFFDHVRREMAGDADRAREHVADLFAYLQRELRTIIPPAGSSRKAVDRELDPEWITSLLRAGALGEIVPRVVAAVRLVREVCAPARDSEVDAVVDRLEALDACVLAEDLSSAATGAKDCVVEFLGAAHDAIDLIHRVRADALNHQLDTVVRPWLRAHAAEYERSKLDQHLTHLYGSRSDKVLEATTGWMRAAADRDRADPCAVLLHNSHALAPKHVFWESILDMCFEQNAVDSSRAPLTLAMDIGRINAFQNDIQVVLSAAALCMLARSISRTTQHAPLTDTHVAKLATDIHALLTNPNVTMLQVVALVHNAVESAPAASKPSDTTAHASTDRLVRKTLSKDDPVYSALERQLRSFLLQELCADESHAQLSHRLDARKQSIDAQLKRFGLDVVSRYVCDLLLRLNRLGSFNWKVCSIWYAKVLALD